MHYELLLHLVNLIVLYAEKQKFGSYDKFKIIGKTKVGK